MSLMEFANKLYLNSSRVYLEEWVRQAAQSVPAGSLVLDAGAGDCPYMPLFAGMRYESADFCQIDRSYGQITYVCDLTDIPVEDNRFDLVLCSEVLTQIPEPKKVLQEFYRILRPGAALWISGNFYYTELNHSYDYYRYTSKGFRYLLEQSGFEIKQIEWLEGYYGTLAYQLKTAAASLPIGSAVGNSGLIGILGSIPSLILKPFFYLLSLYYGRLDTRVKVTNRGHCKNYAIVAIKPADSQGAA
jgi:SAM-dependent methyltransferase